MITYFNRLFTTNYDTLLEEAYGEDSINVVSCGEECAKPEKDVNLYKIPMGLKYKIPMGLKHPNQLVITLTD